MDGAGELTYALEGSVFVTGAAVQWLRDGLGLLDNAAQSEALARSVPDSAGVVFVPALTGLGAPDWDPDARGAVFGITRGTTRAHLVRATLEAIAFEVRDVADVMTEATGQHGRALRADGGASANDLLMQCRRISSSCRWSARWWARPPRSAPRSWPAWPPGPGLPGTNWPPPGGWTGGSSPGPAATRTTPAGGARWTGSRAGPPGRLAGLASRPGELSAAPAPRCCPG